MDDKPDITAIGQTNFRGQHRTFGIYPDDRRRHVYVIGKTGVGKSTLIENMIAQDIVNGKGVALVDPHGDAAERLLDAVPPHRINDVIYFDPSDVDNPVAFNVLEAIDPAYKYLVASGLVSSLKKIWADSWGPRLEYILRNTILALLDYPSSTILGILRMLSDQTYRKKVVEKISDPVVKAFWTNEFANYNERFRSEAISPIQNKVGQFLSSAIIRNIVAQPKSTIDMKDIMDNGKILLINVSKGKIGEDNSALLGAMLINRIQLAAMDRASIPEHERRDFYLYVDEFQNFATESFATILSEARKYRLNLTIAHQYIAQMEEEVSEAVFGNVGTIISFRVGATDAEYLEKEFFPTFLQTDLVNLNKFNAYVKLMINGVTSRPFSMQTIPPDIKMFGHKDKVMQVSRERYSNPREQVEEKIKRWSGLVLEGNAAAGAREQRDPRDRGERGDRDRPQYRNDRNDGAPRPQKQPQLTPVDEANLHDVVLRPTEPAITDLASALQQRSTTEEPRRDRSRAEPQRSRNRESQSDTQLFTGVCATCGKEVQVPFEPTPGRPLYCKEHYEQAKQNRQQASRQLSPKPAAPVARPPQPREMSLADLRPPNRSSEPQRSDSFSGPRPPQVPGRP